MSSRSPVIPRLRYVVLAVVALVALGATAFAVRKPAGPSPDEIRQDAAQGAKFDEERAAERQRIASRPVVVFVGDSYTGGSAIGGREEKGWPQLVSARLDWSPRVLAGRNTGFIAGAGVGATFVARVPRVARQRPDVVIVAGGASDLRSRNVEIAAAAKELLTELRAALPSARLILVAPLVPGKPGKRLLHLRDSLAAVAAETATDYIDPVAEQWLSGPQARFIGRDGRHPTDEGHAAIAAFLEPRLAALAIPRRATQETAPAP